jgi:hypothetical protein
MDLYTIPQNPRAKLVEGIAEKKPKSVVDWSTSEHGAVCTEASMMMGYTWTRAWFEPNASHANVVSWTW